MGFAALLWLICCLVRLSYALHLKWLLTLRSSALGRAEYTLVQSANTDDDNNDDGGMTVWVALCLLQSGSSVDEVLSDCLAALLACLKHIHFYFQVIPPPPPWPLISPYTVSPARVSHCTSSSSLWEAHQRQRCSYFILNLHVSVESYSFLHTDLRLVFRSA